jgi:cytochrome c553
MNSFDLTWNPFAWLKSKHALFWLLIGAISQGALAQTPIQAHSLHLRAHASLCLSCHTEASLRGLSKEAFLDKMRAFQDSPIKDQVMNQMAKGLNQAQVLELAQFFSSPRGNNRE